MSKHRVLSFKSQPRLERRGQDGQHETEKPDHLARLGDSVTSSTRTRFSVHTAADSNFLCRLLQLRQNASVVAQGCADFSSDPTDRNHSFAPDPRRALNHYVRV